MFAFTIEVNDLYTEVLRNTTVVRECSAALDRAAVHFSLFSTQPGTIDQ